MRQPAPDPERLDALVGMPHELPRRAVLIVDDEPSIVDLLCEFLEDAGYRALLARNGRSALAIARRERPALVITDRNMPGIDGMDLLRRLRSSPLTSNIPVVIMSSTRPSIEGTERVPFLAKPFDLDDMLATVATYAGPPDGRR
jgi:DNA-binding response OmpR family regulator